LDAATAWDYTSETVRGHLLQRGLVDLDATTAWDRGRPSNEPSIPKSSPLRLVVEREPLLAAIRRVAVDQPGPGLSESRWR
jgi:hypothetical protein